MEAEVVSMNLVVASVNTPPFLLNAIPEYMEIGVGFAETVPFPIVRDAEISPFFFDFLVTKVSDKNAPTVSFYDDKFAQEFNFINVVNKDGKKVSYSA